MSCPFKSVVPLVFSGSSNALLVAGSPPRPVRTNSRSSRRHIRWAHVPVTRRLVTESGSIQPRLHSSPVCWASLEPLRCPRRSCSPAVRRRRVFLPLPPAVGHGRRDGQPVAATCCINCSALFPCPLRLRRRCCRHLFWPVACRRGRPPPLSPAVRRRRRRRRLFFSSFLVCAPK